MGGLNCKCNCDNKEKEKNEVNFDTYPTNSNDKGKIQKYFKIEEKINNTEDQTTTQGNNKNNNNFDNYNNDERDELKIDINNDNNFLNDDNNKMEENNQMLKAMKNNNNNNNNENENNINNNNENYSQNNLENNRYYNNNNQINNNNNNNNQSNNNLINNNQINNNNNNNNNQINNNQINNNFANEINKNFNNDIKKNSISPINQSPSQTNYINTDNFTTKNNKSNTNQIETSFQKQLSNLNIDKINFGIETKEKENLSYEEKKLFNEAEKNLNKFFPPEKKDLKQIAKKLSKISFKNFIPTEKLNKISLNDENLIIFHGELNKMINYETNAHKPQMYTSKFCVLYPKYFKYYKSKENFLRNLKPSCVINLNQITKINMAKVRKTSTKIDHIILCNKMGIINKNNENDIGNLIDVNKYLYLPENRESLLIFTSSEGEEVVFKWFMIIQYFVQKNKENNENFDNFNNNNNNFNNNNNNFDNNNNNEEENFDYNNNNFDNNNENYDNNNNNNYDDENNNDDVIDNNNEE